MNGEALSVGVIALLMFVGILYFVISSQANTDERPNRPSTQGRPNRPPAQDRPTRLGKRGEERVRMVIGETIENAQYVINDLILANGGYTSQIDHVVINPRGIFVIETKNYSGRIYGSESQREWTQVLAYGQEKHKIYNPLMQNATHIYNVKRIVGNLPVYSLVVFAQNNTDYIKANNVIPLSALRRVLQSGETVLSIQQMKFAYHALLSSKAEISMEEHIRNIRAREQYRH